MAGTKPSLDELRAEIDQIDDALHDLLIKRAQIALQIGMVKGAHNAPVLRPNREAAILRRLLARHRGPFPKIALVRIWREIISSVIGLQAPFSIALYQPEGDESAVHLARNHYGLAANLILLRSPGHVVQAVMNGEASVGLVPTPGQENQLHLTPWWVSILPDTGDMPRIIARLPFADSNSKSQSDMVAISYQGEDVAKCDRIWLGIETQKNLSRDRLKSILDNVGMSLTSLAVTHHNSASWFHIVEVMGPLDDRKERLESLTAQDESIMRTVFLGGHALPFSAAELNAVD